MRNEAADIVQDHLDDSAEAAGDLKTRARAAWDATRETYQKVQDKTIEYSRAADTTIRENPYAALGVAFGAGLLLGWVLTRNSDED